MVNYLFLYFFLSPKTKLWLHASFYQLTDIEKRKFYPKYKIRQHYRSPHFTELSRQISLKRERYKKQEIRLKNEQFFRELKKTLNLKGVQKYFDKDKIKNSQRLFKKQRAHWVNTKKWFLNSLPENLRSVCGYCQIKVEKASPHQKLEPHHRTIDHIIPVSKGGHPYHFDNLIVCCSKCNLMKENTV